MFNLLKQFPHYIKEAIELPVPKQESNISNIVICGMGGSGISGDILKHYLLDKIKVPVIVVKDYSIPEFVDKNTLVFVVSYSGNTAETIAAFNHARKKKAKIVAITSNGKLKKLCRNCILIPKEMYPREAIAYLFFPLLNLLSKSKIIKNKDKEIKGTIKLLKHFNPEKAKALAQKIKGKIPIIYASEKYAPLAYRLKTQINENSKLFAAAGVFSEVNHNEIEARFDSRFAIILFQSPKEERGVAKQIKAFKYVVSAKINEIRLEGKNELARIFYGIYFGDWLSYYLAKLNNINMIKTDRIDKVKRMIK